VTSTETSAGTLLDWSPEDETTYTRDSTAYALQPPLSADLTPELMARIL
jgi:hypothetical protein